MPILERKIVHEMATVCSHISYPRFVLPLHKHVEYEIMLFTQGSGKQFEMNGVQGKPYSSDRTFFRNR